MCAPVPTTVWCVGGHVTGSVRLRTILGNDSQVIVALGLPVKGGLGADDGCVAGGPWHYLKIIIGPLQGKRQLQSHGQAQLPGHKHAGYVW